MKHLVRFFISSLFILGGIWGAYDDVNLMSVTILPESFNLYGIINIISACVVVFIGIFSFIYSLNELFKVHAPFFHSYKIIIICAILGSLLGGGIYSKVQSNIEVQGYVKCTGLTKIATRYTRSTYAKTPEICEQLVKEKYAHN